MWWITNWWILPGGVVPSWRVCYQTCLVRHVKYHKIHIHDCVKKIGVKYIAEHTLFVLRVGLVCIQILGVEFKYDYIVESSPNLYSGLMCVTKADMEKDNFLHKQGLSQNYFTQKSA